MSASDIMDQIRSLPMEEKRRLVRDIFNEFGDEVGWVSPDLTREEIAELERRAEEARRNPEAGISWESIREELRQKHSWR
jgi:putative addiction module component (TIGR02574 family)